MDTVSHSQFGGVNCLLVILFTYSFFICSSVNLHLNSLWLSIFPNFSPASSLSFSSSISFSLHAPRSRGPACSRLCAICPYFSPLNILSRLSSIIFIPKECLCPAVVSPALFPCETSLFQTSWQSVCTFQEGFWSGNADQYYEFLSTGAHEKGMKPNCGHFGTEPQMTSSKLDTVHIYCGLCGQRDRPLWENSLVLPSVFLLTPLSLPVFSLHHCPEWQWFKLSDISRPKKFPA